MNLQEELICIFYEHRAKSFICCDKSCFCWNVEGLLTLIEAEGGITLVAVDGADDGRAPVHCSICGELIAWGDVSHKCPPPLLNSIR